MCTACGVSSTLLGFSSIKLMQNERQVFIMSFSDLLEGNGRILIWTKGKSVEGKAISPVENNHRSSYWGSRAVTNEL